MSDVMTGLGFLGAKKAKAPKQAKPPKQAKGKPMPPIKAAPVRIPEQQKIVPLPPVTYNTAATGPVVVDSGDAPPPLIIKTPVLVQQESIETPGQGKYSKTLDVISQGLQLFNRQGQPTYQPSTAVATASAGGDSDISETAADLGRGAGSFGDAVKRSIEKHPFWYLGGGLGLTLYLLQPKGGGYSRR